MGLRNLTEEIQTFDGDDRSYALHRPDTYIGSVEEKIEHTHYYSDDGQIMFRNFTINKGLLKIFDEVVSNSVDESIKTKFRQSNKINITYDKKSCEIEVTDNGRGISVIEDKKTKKWVPELVFSTLRTGGNFDDSKKEETLGKNGVGVALTNIFSKQFRVNTYDGSKTYTQEFTNNMYNIGKPVIRNKTTGSTYTTVSFIPDYSYFRVSESCFAGLPYLLEKRVRDLAFVYPEIKFSYNGNVINTKKPKDLFSPIDENFNFASSEKCRVAVLFSEDANTISFVNGVNTSSGGSHVDYAHGLISDYLKEAIRKKYKINIKPSDIKNRIMLVLSIKFPGPKFDSQTKDHLVNQVNDFKDRVDEVINEKFLKGLMNNTPLITSLIEIHQLKDLQKAQSMVKTKKIRIPKLVEPQSKNASENILILTEGDSAISELINVRNPNIGGFPLRGKVKNVYGKSPSEVVENEELQNIIKILGLELGKPAINLRYGRIGILTDQDHDGNAIAGLLINFFYRFWPELFEQKRIIRYLSPLFTVNNGKKTLRFYSHKEFEEWSSKNPNSSKAKYHKGLGSLETEEYEIVLNDPFYITLTHDKEAKETIKMAYSDDSGPRKEWLKSATN